jgi:hypothetical protein
MVFSEGMPASRLFAAALAISALAMQLANLSVSPAIAEVASEPASNKAATAVAGPLAGRLGRPLSSSKLVAVRYELVLNRFRLSKAIAIARFEIS